jgi:hypothetical protein
VAVSGRGRDLTGLTRLPVVPVCLARFSTDLMAT